MNFSFIALFLLGHLISVHLPFLPRLPSDVNSKGILKPLDPGDKLLHAYPMPLLPPLAKEEVHKRPPL
jgi:hypothetical protein